jgi:hypothetical protein
VITGGGRLGIRQHPVAQLGAKATIAKDTIGGSVSTMDGSVSGLRWLNCLRWGRVRDYGITYEDIS